MKPKQPIDCFGGLSRRFRGVSAFAFAEDHVPEVDMATKLLAPCVAALCFGLAGCAALPPTVDTPQLPPGVYGVYEGNDIGAVNFATWAFASPARVRGSAINGALAVISVEYLAGELQNNPRWMTISQLTIYKMQQARTDVQRALGIAPGTPPQEVVNVMLAVDWNMRTGNEPGALRALSAPGFTLPPPQTLQILSNLPYIPSANVATQWAKQQMLPGGMIF